MKKEIISNIIWFVSLAVIIILIKVFWFMPVVVSGDSMDPTMENKERVIAFKGTEIERFDIVTFPAPDEPKKNYIKRVIGLPGDTVEFKNDQLLINGKEQKEAYLDEYKAKLAEGDYLTQVYDSEGIAHPEFDLGNLFPATTVPEGKVFVLGDNRQISKDSRLIGFIDKDKISGNVKFSFWPPSKFGKVE